LAFGIIAFREKIERRRDFGRVAAHRLRELQRLGQGLLVEILGVEAGIEIKTGNLVRIVLGRLVVEIEELGDRLGEAVAVFGVTLELHFRHVEEFHRIGSRPGKSGGNIIKRPPPDCRMSRPSAADEWTILTYFTRINISGNLIPGVPIQSQPPS